MIISTKWVTTVFLCVELYICMCQDDSKLVHYDAAKVCNTTNKEGDISCTSITEVEPGKDSNKKNTKINHQQETEIKYGLVPAFLIGASSVIIVYIVSHCLYLHCYTKKKMRHLASQQHHPPAPPGPTIVLNDGDPAASLQAVTPIVTNDGAYGKTEIMSTTTPYVMCQPAEVATTQPTQSSSHKHNNAPTSNTFFFRLFTPSSEPRMSVSSVEGELSGGEMDSGDTSQGRPSICFVPVTPTTPDPNAPSDQPGEWTPVQGFLYSSVLMSNQSPGNDTDSVTNNVEGIQLPEHLVRKDSVPSYHMVLTRTQSTDLVAAQHNQAGPPGTDPPSTSISMATDTQAGLIHHEVEVYDDTCSDRVI